MGKNDAIEILLLSAAQSPLVDSLHVRLQRAVSALAPGVAIEVVSPQSGEQVPLRLRINQRDVVPLRGSGELEAMWPMWLLEVALLRELHPKGLLFLCVANSARSQIGEGVARSLAPPDVWVQSAGSRPTTIRPEALTVLAEIGADTSNQRAKPVAAVDSAHVDTVITLCREEECPVYLGPVRRLHWGLPDPAAVTGTEAERLAAFRHTRDELTRRLALLFASEPV